MTDQILTIAIIVFATYGAGHILGWVLGLAHIIVIKLR